MSARTLRRTFAAPFVVTLAAMPACGPKPLNPPEPHENPPPPAAKPTEPVVAAPDPAPAPSEPVDSKGSPKKEPAQYERRWTVMRNMKQDAKPTECRAFIEVSCPKSEPGKPMPTCNPPPPIPYTCPDNFPTDKGATLKIVLRAGATECFVDHGPMNCPQGAKCNPPPPRKLACPGD
jgi:hypothetical protein